MTLMKNDPRTKEIAKMGAQARSKLHIHTKGEFQTGSKRAIKCGSMGFAALVKKNPSALSEAGKRSRHFENEVAAKLQGEHIFKPNEICDRIVVRNGEVFFIEIKQLGKKLTEKQRLFQRIVGDKYQVIRS